MMELIPLLVFTICSGAATGTALCAAVGRKVLFTDGAKVGGKLSCEAALELVSLVLLCVGLLGTLAHLGQPLRFVNGLSHPSSMISQEAYWSIALAILLAAGTGVGLKRRLPGALMWVGAVAALGLMTVTSLAYFLSWGVPAWNASSTFAVFMVGDVALGVGVCAVLSNREDASWLKACAVAGAASVLPALLLAAQLCAAHAAFDVVPYAVASGLVALCVPLAALAARGKGTMSLRGANALACAALVVATLILRIGFFSAGMA